MSIYDKSDSSYSKQLFKQKYFCQMCNRQCRDKDGFNCHLKSETHKRNVEIVARNPEEFINKYSYEFESGFLDILKRFHSDVFVSANKLYQDYISDKSSTHLNATKWTSLTGFLKYLETKGKCELIITDKEIKIKYVDTSPESIREKKERDKRIQADLKEEKKRIEEMKKIMEKAEVAKNEIKIKEGLDNKSSYVDPESLKNISITIENKAKSDLQFSKPINIFSNNIVKKNSNILLKPNDQDFHEESTLIGNKRNNDRNHNNKIQNKLDPQLNHNYEENIEIDLENIPWLSKGLVVRIKDKNLNEGKFLNRKALVNNIELENEYIAEVELITDNPSFDKIKLKIDQAYLEPVIPRENSLIKILFGKYKDKLGELIEINLKQKTCIIKLISKESLQMPLYNICKFNELI